MWQLAATAAVGIPRTLTQVYLPVFKFPELFSWSYFFRIIAKRKNKLIIIIIIKPQKYFLYKCYAFVNFNLDSSRSINNGNIETFLNIIMVSKIWFFFSVNRVPQRHLMKLDFLSEQWFYFASRLHSSCGSSVFYCSYNGVRYSSSKPL